MCDVAVKHGVIAEPKPGVVETSLMVYGDGSTTSLPSSVRKFFGLSGTSGAYNKPAEVMGVSSSLMRHNDNDPEKGGMTFAQIADLIESEPEGLFEKTVDSESTVE